MGECIIPSPNSLVRYSNPVVVSKKDDKTPSWDKKAAVKSSFISTAVKKDVTSISKETEEILNCILPPREWQENGLLWRQKVSSDPATRLDVLKLGEQLDLRLQQRQAREAGICPVRRELFTQCFDELIRQVTINCAERGLLLLRARDELRMTMAAYQSLYESSIAFGIRKALQAEQGKSDREELIITLQSEKRQLEEQIEDMKMHAEQMERRFNELTSIEQKKHNEEVQFLKKTNQQLKAQLEGIIAPKK